MIQGTESKEDGKKTIAAERVSKGQSTESIKCLLVNEEAYV